MMILLHKQKHNNSNCHLYGKIIVLLLHVIGNCVILITCLYTFHNNLIFANRFYQTISCIMKRTQFYISIWFAMNAKQEAKWTTYPHYLVHVATMYIVHMWKCVFDDRRWGAGNEKCAGTTDTVAHFVPCIALANKCLHLQFSMLLRIELSALIFRVPAV